jgi:hypothetical protein
MWDASAFTAALLSPGPNPAIPPDKRIFAPFIGSWRLIVTWYDEDGKPSRRENGEWHFAWVLQGMGVQDVWIVPPRDEGGEPHEYGTSLRFYDAEIGAWRSTWIGPKRQSIERFIARQVGDEVVLETTRESGERMRWIFSDVTAAGFRWRNMIERRGEWTLTQDFVAVRR